MEERIAQAFALCTTYGYSARTIEFSSILTMSITLKTAVTHGIEEGVRSIPSAFRVCFTPS
jgi:hypothetical protein